jgi:hypothetical protein
MSTNSVIGVMHGDNCKAVYCHSDGYLSYNGQVLLDNYDSAKANHLVSLGDMSVLGKVIGEKIDFNAHMEYDENNIAKQCRFYGRDRGESDVEFTSVSSFAQLCEHFNSAYYYIMKDGVWYVSIGGAQLLVLSEVLTKEVA